MATLTGGCLCERVRYTITSEPITSTMPLSRLSEIHWIVFRSICDLPVCLCEGAGRFKDLR
jgi:hypothetical protein